jgi:hypothetical protein
MRHSSRLLAITLGFATAACGGKPEEDDPLSADGKADSIRSPTPKGTLAAEAQRRATLGEDEAFHAWTFLVGEEADVTVETSPGREGDPLDTVLYLYQRGEEGAWGRYLVKNDDGGGHADGGFSSIERRLEPGQYRIIVKGYQAGDRGEYTVKVSGFTTDCAFGTIWGELDRESPVQVQSEKTLTAADIERLADWERAQIVRAMRASSFDEVTTVEQAFEAVDGGEINRFTLSDEAGVRSFRTWEYGAGDNSFGAIFVNRGDDRPVAEIHDGDLAGCQVKLQACLFGAAFDGFNDAGLLVEGSADRLTPSSTLTAAEARQVLAAVDHSDWSTAAEAIEAVDGSEMTVTDYEDPRDGTRYRYYHFYSGDTPVGAAFEGDGDEAVIRMGDGELLDCRRFY